MLFQHTQYCIKKLSFILDEDGRLLENSMTESQAQCQKTVEAALHTIMNPISSQLIALPDLPAWNSRQLASTHLSFSFSPQEYITQVCKQ